jgi:iron-sulfur cluster repair protein YtfE (RIC family)
MPEDKPERLDAIAILIEEHRAARALFQAFEDVAPDDTAARRGIVELACRKLEIHAILEQEVFYPAAREQLAAHDVHLIDDDAREHGAAAALIARLAAVAPGDPAYPAAFRRFGEQMTAHFRKEEREIFPRLENGALDLDAIGRDMQERREALSAEGETPGQPEPSREAEGCNEPSAEEALARAATLRE